MSPYTAVATIVTFAVYFCRRSTWSSIAGSVLVGIIWPVLIPMGIYFGIKVWLLGHPMAQPRVLDLEIFGCILVTAVGFAWIVVHRGLLAL